MQQYRFQFLDGSGSVYAGRMLEAIDDAEALELARLFDHPFAIRVWCGEREVGTVWLGRKRAGPALEE